MKNDPKFVRDSNTHLKFLTFQLSNVRELKTIKHASGLHYAILLQVKPIMDWIVEVTQPAVQMLHSKEEKAVFHKLVSECSPIGAG